MTLGGQAAACRNQQRQGISSPFPRFALPNNGSPIPTGARKIPNAESSITDRENAIPATVPIRQQPAGTLSRSRTMHVPRGVADRLTWMTTRFD